MWFVHVLVHQGEHGITLEGHFTRQHGIGDDPQRVLIRRTADALTAPLLRCHVKRCPHRHTGLGQRGGGVHQLGDAEIDHEGGTVIVKHHVAGLHIPVDDTFLMRVVERAGKLTDDLGSLAH